MANRINISELDFDSIKLNLKNFLRQQDQFTDYDFEGSGLSVLLDVLALNTHYNAYYLNMVANESFLDTASLRDSVVSLAKTLGYTPYSKKAPYAEINVRIPSNSAEQSTLLIPRGYGFLSNQIDGVSYRFIVLDDTTVTKSNSAYYFENLPIYEGQMASFSYIYDQTANPKQIFTIPEENIDIDSLRVTVSPTPQSLILDTYTKVTDITEIGPDSLAYFLQESYTGKYQIYFGNGSLGKALGDGSVVRISYIVTNSSLANKANNFVATLPLVDGLGENLTNFIITPVAEAVGGAERESVDSIKYGAPLQYAAQNRLVTYKDYEVYLRNKYPNIDSVSVWGGEDEVPPTYGKVFISLKPKSGYYISETEKSYIINTLIKPKQLVTVLTEVRDPDYLYLLVNAWIQYDPSKTILTKEALKQIIRDSVVGYNDNYLNKFSAKFVVSKLQEDMCAVDKNSIIGCDAVVVLQKRFTPTLGQVNNYTLNFNLPLAQADSKNKLISNEFYVYDEYGIQRKVIIEEVPKSYTGINSIQILDSGVNYTSTPTVTITGDGFGATAKAIVVNGRVDRIEIVTPGIDYNKAVVTISGGGGTGASAIAVLDTKIGTLRTVYFNADAERQVVNDNAGSINYEDGIIQLNDMLVISTTNSDGTININCLSDKNVIKSIRNTILTINEQDPNSIIINLESVS